ncbi:MAG: DUF378 domain-containing protein [Nanoarchaeota archaeon]
MVKSTLEIIALVLLVIGGLNWGLVGLFNGLNVVDMLGSTLAQIIYVLVGISAIYAIFFAFKK